MVIFTTFRTCFATFCLNYKVKMVVGPVICYFWQLFLNTWNTSWSSKESGIKSSLD